LSDSLQSAGYFTERKVSKTFKENMEIFFDDYLGKWNYRAISDVKI
jgi:hypothetical protein